MKTLERLNEYTRNIETCTSLGWVVDTVFDPVSSKIIDIFGIAKIVEILKDIDRQSYILCHMMI